jgi:hypothetical protein
MPDAVPWYPVRPARWDGIEARGSNPLSSTPTKTAGQTACGSSFVAAACVALCAVRPLPAAGGQQACTSEPDRMELTGPTRQGRAPCVVRADASAIASCGVGGVLSVPGLERPRIGGLGAWLGLGCPSGAAPRRSGSAGPIFLAGAAAGAVLWWMACLLIPAGWRCPARTSPSASSLLDDPIPVSNTLLPGVAWRGTARWLLRRGRGAAAAAGRDGRRVRRGPGGGRCSSTAPRTPAPDRPPAPRRGS